MDWSFNGGIPWQKHQVIEEVMAGAEVGAGEDGNKTAAMTSLTVKLLTSAA